MSSAPIVRTTLGNEHEDYLKVRLAESALPPFSQHVTLGLEPVLGRVSLHSRIPSP